MDRRATGSRRIEVGHLDGNEENKDATNLIWDVPCVISLRYFSSGE